MEFAFSLQYTVLSFFLLNSELVFILVIECVKRCNQCSGRGNKCVLVIIFLNRHSIESLWKNLRDTNPELLVDFEDFVSEIAEEVQGAQRALE